MTNDLAHVHRLVIRTTNGDEAVVRCPRQGADIYVAHCQTCGHCIGLSVRDSYVVCGCHEPNETTLEGHDHSMTSADSSQKTHGSPPHDVTIIARALGRFERPIVTATLDDTAFHVACRLRDQHVGCVVVVRDGRPVGILTDRDIVLRVIAEGLDAQAVLVSSIVTYDAMTISTTDGIETAVRKMREHGVRRLPIVDTEGRVTGIVTADDLVALLSHELSALGEAISSNVDGSESR